MSAMLAPGARLSRRHVCVHGRVQGVGFRVATKRRATAHGVAGWVRNLPDGSVEAVFEGEAAEVERLLEWCARGPRGALVARLDVHEEPPEGLVGFEFRA